MIPVNTKINYHKFSICRVTDHTRKIAVGVQVPVWNALLSKVEPIDELRFTIYELKFKQ